MRKNIKDMDFNEKQSQIQRLLYKFYDVKTTPSLLLTDEMQYANQDIYILNAIKKLETLETQHHILEDKYYATLSTKMRHMKRVFEYEQEQLTAEHRKDAKPQAFDPMNKFIGRTGDDRYQQKMADLKRSQNERIKEIDHAAFAELKACNRELRTVFIDAVNHLYR